MTNIEYRNRETERGNVLFLILIAVALFAALSYAVTQSTRSGSGDASGETNLINSAQLAQYPAGVRTSVVRMVIGGISVDQLVFNQPTNFDDVSDLRYAVFHPQGGGAVFQRAPQELLDQGAAGAWIFSSHYQVDGIGSTNSGDLGANEIIAFLPGVSQNICRRLNREVGITSSNADGIPDNLGGDVPTNSVPAAAQAMLEGVAGSSPGIPLTDGIIGGDMAGQPFGCYRVGAANATYPTRTYVYYHVLVER